MSLCGMPYDDTGDGYAECWEEKHVRARKDHICTECGGVIKRGEQYGSAKALGDGAWHNWKRCRACLLLAEMVAMVMGECALWGCLGDYISIQAADEGHEFPSPVEFRKRWEAVDDV